MTISDMLTRLEAFNLYREAADVLMNNEQEILSLNKEQLMDGVDKENVKLRDYHFPWYADFKSRLNSKGVTDLKVTGAFHNGFAISLVGDNKYQIFSRDSKNNMLVNGWTGRNGVSVPGYGQKIFGLTEESVRLARERFFNNGIAAKLAEKVFG